MHILFHQIALSEQNQCLQHVRIISNWGNMYFINYLKREISRRSVNYISQRLILGRNYPHYLEKLTGKAGKFKKNQIVLDWLKKPEDSERQVNREFMVNVLQGSREATTPFSLELDKCGDMCEVSEKRVIFIWNFLGSPIVSEVFLNLINSAKDSNIETYSINSESPNNDESKNRKIADIIEMKPNLIMLQLHTGLNHDGKSLLNFEDIEYIVSETGCAVAILCFDIWRLFDISYVDYWSRLNPTFLHVDPDSVNLLPTEISRMFLAWPYIVQSVNTHRNPPKPFQKRIFFSGSIKFQDRRFWLYALTLMCSDSNIELNLNIFNYSKPEKRLREVDYKEELTKSLAMISFSRKSEEHCVIPFRAFQAAANGVLVLQETNTDRVNLGYFYAPFIHFLPFSSPSELKLRIEWLSNNATIASEMARDALNFHDTNYFPERLWKYLFHKIQLKDGLQDV